MWYFCVLWSIFWYLKKQPCTRWPQHGRRTRYVQTYSLKINYRVPHASWTWLWNATNLATNPTIRVTQHADYKRLHHKRWWWGEGGRNFANKPTRKGVWPHSAGYKSILVYVKFATANKKYILFIFLELIALLCRGFFGHSSHKILLRFRNKRLRFLKY